MDEYLPIGRTVADRHGSADAVFISGSLVEGIGNPASDLDVFVVYETDADRHPLAEEDSWDMGDYAVEIDYVDGLRVDVETWSVDRMMTIAKAIADCPDGDTTAAADIPFAYLKLAHSVRVALPVVAPARLTELQAAFDWEKLARVLANRFSGDYNGAAEDAVGAVQADDAETAMLNSRRALGLAVDAYLAACGATNGQPKWRFAKLRALGDAELLAAYRAAELDGSPDEKDMLDASRSRLRMASDLIQRAGARLAAHAVS